MILELAGGLAELVDWFRAAFSAWRYLFSPAYRRHVHDDWQSMTWYAVAWDVLCAFAGFAFSLLLGYLLVALFSGLDWLPRLFSR